MHYLLYDAKCVCVAPLGKGSRRWFKRTLSDQDSMYIHVPNTYMHV